MEQTDIFFLSYNESNAEKHWYDLKCRFPHSRRIHGVKGIGLAHQMCAHLSKSPYFFVVNADNKVLQNFYFNLPHNLDKSVYCWRSINPINGLAYGFGAIKLFPKQSRFCFSQTVDVSTSLKIPYKIVYQQASITYFNSSPLEAFRGAFRECAKLASQCIDSQKSKQSYKRLQIWCEKNSYHDSKSENKKFALLGAIQGREYGKKHKNKPEDLFKLNDFDWLKSIFIKSVGAIST